MLCSLKVIFICTCAEYVSSKDIFSNNKTNLSQSDLNILHGIMSSKISVDAAQNDTAVFDYIYNQTDNRDNAVDNLEFNAVDPKTMAKLFNSAKTKTLLANTKLNKTLRVGRPYKPYPEHEAYYWYTNFFVSKAMDLMKQSIYATRYRLQDTRDLRKKFSAEYCYNIAIFYGSLMQIRMKMDNVFATMNKLGYAVKFIHYLILYERTLQLSVDVNYMVEKMFALYEMHIKGDMSESGEKESTPNIPIIPTPPQP